MVAWFPYSPKTSSEERLRPGFERCAVAFLDNDARRLRDRERGEQITPEDSGVAPSASTASTLPVSGCLLELLDDAQPPDRRWASARRPKSRPAAARAREGPAGP